MTFFVVIILGIVQGFTEFLPISSSGHLILFEKLFNINCDLLLFNIALHIGSLAAVLIFYRKQIFQLIKNPFSPLAKKLYLSTLISVIFVIIFEKFLMSSFGNNFYIIGFLVTVIILTLSHFVSKKKASKKSISYLSSGIIGFSQAIACLPGISRSGTTLCTSLLLGNDKEESINFCFLMSIPIIIASLFYELIKGKGSAQPINIYLILIGVLTSFICGLIAIKFMLKLLKQKSLLIFAVYLVILLLFICLFVI